MSFFKKYFIRPKVQEIITYLQEKGKVRFHDHHYPHDYWLGLEELGIRLRGNNLWHLDCNSYNFTFLETLWLWEYLRFWIMDWRKVRYYNRNTETY